MNIYMYSYATRLLVNCVLLIPTCLFYGSVRHSKTVSLLDFFKKLTKEIDSWQKSQIQTFISTYSIINTTHLSNKSYIYTCVCRVLIYLFTHNTCGHLCIMEYLFIVYSKLHYNISTE